MDRDTFPSISIAFWPLAPPPTIPSSVLLSFSSPSSSSSTKSSSTTLFLILFLCALFLGLACCCVANLYKLFGWDGSDETTPPVTRPVRPNVYVSANVPAPAPSQPLERSVIPPLRSMPPLATVVPVVDRVVLPGRSVHSHVIPRTRTESEFGVPGCESDLIWIRTTSQEDEEGFV
ncbi:Aste57867_9522 [Aphanomyces stellatus]|uniref:Aste57867_9522 protein n=1 Tax=Aphanomyces stellatus TaxID=120398 RepID=A0A485KN36_9STRA|nr:hypothetical protein As57867_009485 [Aphanomyces stellatus]VFT86401.1 Aste57867_9522 [Aphanomyces stellatus]